MRFGNFAYYYFQQTSDHVSHVTEHETREVNRVQSLSQYVLPTEKDALIKAKVAGIDIDFLIDSGAQVNTITKASFNKILADQKASSQIFSLQSTSDKPLKAYGMKDQIEVVANFSAELFVSDDRPVSVEKFYVVDEVRALLGFNTAIRYSVLDIGLNVPVHRNQRQTFQSEGYCAQAVSIAEEFPKFNIPPVTLRYNTAMPPARNVYTHIPSAFKELTKQKLKYLLTNGIIEEVTMDMDRSFCSSLLVVPKGKDDIRIVIDLRGPNRCIYRTPFKMPTLESILMELHGAKWFSTIDLQNAFFHIELDEGSRHLTIFFAGDGLYRYRRLPFGLTNAPDIFQEVLQTVVLAGCEGQVNYLDDIMVFGKTKKEHDENLAQVMKCLANHNVKINESKCAFGKQTVDFLGFVVSDQGWKIEDEKIAALKNFRHPESIAEVKSFLGLVNFVEKFIPNRADKTIRLRALAKADRYYWNQELNDEFEFLKHSAWKTITTLGYFNREDRTELFVDASPYGLGAVLVQFDSDSKPRVIACASKALSATEQKYPQTQKEALAMVWAVERFSTYLMSISFTIRTDAESNEFIFGGLHRIGKRAVTRAESWALRLQPYNFSVKRIPGELNVADALSRLVKQTQPEGSFDEEADDNHLLYFIDAGAMEISWDEIEEQSERDSELKNVRTSIETGCWEAGLRRYESQSKELSICGSSVFKNDKIVLPNSLRQKAIQSAHQGHLGIGSTKRILREHFWWPGMTSEVEFFIKHCETCLLLSRKNPPIPLTNRELPRGPWEILQIDFFTDKEFGFGEFLVIVDTYSRYLSVIEMKKIDADATIKALNEVFAEWGYPLVMQSDNGPPFQSDKFVRTWENKGIKIRKSLPLSPQSNGAVERQNEGIKRALAASKLDGINWKLALNKYVHVHNKVRPLTRLGVTPFELLVGWKFRGTFPGLWKTDFADELDREDIKEKDAFSKLQSKKNADLKRKARDSDLTVGDKVVLSQIKRNKSDPSFNPEKFTIVAREGAKIVVQSNRGVIYTRNVGDAKKVLADPIEQDQETLGSSQNSNVIDDDSQQPGRGKVLYKYKWTTI